MRRFSNLNSYELTEVQYIIQDIYKDFQELGI